eukprot:6196209-Ditylum_brightwellii.AAC.1
MARKNCNISLGMAPGALQDASLVPQLTNYAIVKQHSYTMWQAVTTVIFPKKVGSNNIYVI